MGFLDNVKDALRSVVTSQPSKDQAARREAAAKDEVVADRVDVVAEPAAAGTAEDVREAKPATFETYTVRTGDSLPEIGARFGVTALEIARLNDIENPDLIFPGQVFRIPTS